VGLFGGTTIYVSSVASNLAGDETKRPNYLKTTVLGHFLTTPKLDLADVISSGYLHGPRIKLRQFFDWAYDHYDLIGMPTAQLITAESANNTIIKGQIELEIGEAVVLQKIDFGAADHTWWAGQWITENYPFEYSSGWTSTYDRVSGQITVTFADTSIHSFTPIGFDEAAQYIYALYSTADIDASTDNGVFIYAFGSGNTTLDAIQTVHAPSAKEFYPFIPVRIDNNFLSDTYHPDAYALAKKAFRKATSQKLDKLIDQLAENEHLDDMDYAYVMFGVSVNTLENASRKYIYNFFKLLMDRQNENSGSEYTNFRAQFTTFVDANTTWQTWNTAQSDITDPLYGTPEPYHPALPGFPLNSFKIRGSGTLDTNYDIEIMWVSIEEETGAGLGKTGAKKDDVWFEARTPDVMTSPIGKYSDSFAAQLIFNRVYLYHQIDDSQWTRLSIIGMRQFNYIHKGHAVDIKLIDGIADDHESGFIVPLHETTLKSMSMVDTTQMITACAYLVINCYVEKHTSFLSGLFNFIITVAIIVVATLILGPESIALSIGMAATAAIGITGLLAIIVASVINAIAAMILTAILKPITTALFGEAFGAFLATLVSAAIVGDFHDLFAGNFSAMFASTFGNLSSAVNILKLTSAVGNGISAYIQDKATSVIEETQDLVDRAGRQSLEIQNKYLQTFGFEGGVLDPMGIMNAEISLESPNSFLSRTLMTGSDIADMSLTMLNNFTDISLTTDLFLS